jgi:hypothetical protein
MPLAAARNSAGKATTGAAAELVFPYLERQRFLYCLPPGSLPDPQCILPLGRNPIWLSSRAAITSPRRRPAGAWYEGTDEFVGLEMAPTTKCRQRFGHVQPNEKGDAGNVNDLITPSPYCVVPSFDPFSLLTRLIVCTHNNHIIAERVVCVKSIVAKIHPIICSPLRAGRR